jgi:hypothetical protein
MSWEVPILQIVVHRVVHVVVHVIVHPALRLSDPPSSDTVDFGSRRLPSCAILQVILVMLSPPALEICLRHLPSGIVG